MKTWKDCNGQDLLPGDICKFSEDVIQEKIASEDIMLQSEAIRDAYEFQWRSQTFSIDHLLLTGEIHVSNKLGLCAMLPELAQFINRPAKEIEECE